MFLVKSTEGPAWSLFRADLKRYWGRTALWSATILCVLIVILRLSISRYFVANPYVQPRWLPDVLDTVGLNTKFLGLLFCGRGPFAFEEAVRHPDLVLIAVIAPMINLLMPAYAVRAIARDNQNRLLTDPRIPALTPVRVLVLKSLAAFLPFVMLFTVAFMVSTCWDIALVILSHSRTVPDARQIFAGYQDCFMNSLMGLIGFAAQIGVFASVAVICDSTSKAVTVCYAMALIPAVLFLRFERAMERMVSPIIDVPFAAVPLATLVVWGFALVVLLPLALARLREWRNGQLQDD